jgi:predicted GIY-YIG superfamily endonuclease
MTHVYELRDGDQVVYVGKTINIKLRLQQHTRFNTGKFLGQHHLTIHVIKSFEDSKEAFKYEGKLKTKHGFEWTEMQQMRRKKTELRKLTQEEADEIRSKYIPFKYTCKQLGEEYGVHGRTIDNIIKGRTYASTGL